MSVSTLRAAIKPAYQGSRRFASSFSSIRSSSQTALRTNTLKINQNVFIKSSISLNGTSSLNRQSVRHLNVHEYQAVELFHKYGIATPRCGTASTPEEAFTVASQFGSDVVVKAQVLSGGRGKGRFDNGYQGGVHVVDSPEAAKEVAAKMLGHRLITKQSGAEGKPCHKVLVTERMYLRRETYFSILMDRKSEGPVMVASPAGGMDIEQVAHDSPELIFKERISLEKGPEQAQLQKLATAMGFTGKAAEQAVLTMGNLWKLFVGKDATLVEINPLAETHDKAVLCVDAKVNFDDNALFRQPDLVSYRDPSQEDKREVEAEKYGLNYIGLDGNIGCLVNGAGLAMATMDAIKLYGGSPANFLDLGGGASKEQVTAAFNLLNQDKNVKAVLVNIFGGIMRCDVIALGLIAAATQLGLKKPVVIRLAGTNVAEAIKLIDDSGLRMLTAHDLGDAASRVVRIVDILRMAEEAHISVDFQLPL